MQRSQKGIETKNRSLLSLAQGVRPNNRPDEKGIETSSQAPGNSAVTLGPNNRPDEKGGKDQF
jgi:hypothetical protein